MATFYSSFFNSGLLAVDAEGVHRPRTPDPSTPRAFNKSFADDTTPTASNFSVTTSPVSNDVLPSLLAQTEAITIGADRPRMRRRRSSVGLSSSPVAPLKTAPPLPRAAVHLQRQSLPTGMMSPSRTRSGSITEALSYARSTMSMAPNDATKSNSLMGRLRSGSVGTSLRSASRRLRKPVATNAPAPPPPTAPLPAPPVPSLPEDMDLATLPRTPRRPFGRRAQTTDGVPIVLHTPSITIPNRRATNMEDSLPSSPLGGDDDDYPTALETPGEIRGEYFA